ncbi:MAG: hypothetical protein IJV07_02070 [Alphaproteobacteria bacterium]|nr:hypothetical protein [Alphaproteobacteria bacterium]
MGFSWTTFLAQIVNLFVLVLLMKRYLYGPIVAVITKRQAYIEDKVKQAEQAVQSADKQKCELEKQVTAWQRDRQTRLDSFYAEMTALRQEQTERLQLEGEALRQKMQDDLNRETQTKQLEIRDMMVQNFMALSRRVLSDLSGLAPMSQSLVLFQKKVSALSKTEVATIRKSLQKTGRIAVETSDKLTDKERNTLAAFLTDIFGQAEITFGQQPDLILGIEVVAGETVLEWNLKTYLDLFEGNLNTALAGLIVKE